MVGWWTIWKSKFYTPSSLSTDEFMSDYFLQFVTNELHRDDSISTNRLPKYCIIFSVDSPVVAQRSHRRKKYVFSQWLRTRTDECMETHAHIFWWNQEAGDWSRMGNTPMIMNDYRTNKVRMFKLVCVCVCATVACLLLLIFSLAFLEKRYQFMQRML